MPEFCQKCYDEFVKHFREVNNDPTIKIDKNGMIFACKTPIMYMDGDTLMVKIWDHDLKKEVHMLYAEYKKRKLEGSI